MTVFAAAPRLDRRAFLASAAALGASFAAGRPAELLAQAAAPPPTILKIATRTLEVNKKPAKVFGLTANDKPGIRMKAGDAFKAMLSNETAEPTIVHWHGLTPPWEQDGVADAPLPMIAPGSARGYDFKVATPGTFWMHAHTLQEQRLLAAPLIVEDPADKATDIQDVVVLLHDFSFTPPEELLKRLTGSDGMGAMAGHDMGAMTATAGAHAGHDMSAMTMDVNDIEFDAYLANDRTLDDPEVFAVEKGGRVRLRIINGGAATAFTIDLGEVQGALTAVDGHDIEPVVGKRFPIAPGQRLDIVFRLPGDGKALPVLALREGAVERTGFVLRPAGAAVEKIAPRGRDKAPVLDLALESRLKAKTPLAARKADKAIAVDLAGDMMLYKWGIGATSPLTVSKGERVELRLVNRSMMAHPMHLHGHAFQVVAVGDRRIPGAVRDTVLVPAMGGLTIAFDADNPGTWPFHCHNLYHMVAGMMANVAYG
ncbi:MAG: multicopper oxidase family protein [Bauldia sp.]